MCELCISVCGGYVCVCELCVSVCGGYVCVFELCIFVFEGYVCMCVNCVYLCVWRVCLCVCTCYGVKRGHTPGKTLSDRGHILNTTRFASVGIPLARSVPDRLLACPKEYCYGPAGCQDSHGCGGGGVTTLGKGGF